MRVLHLCTDFWPSTGGIETFIGDLARFSRPAGIEPAVLCLNRVYRSNERLPAREEIAGIPIRRVPFINLKYYKPAWLPLAELKRADVLHVHGIGANLDFAALTRPLHRKPIVLSTHGGIFHAANLSGLKKTYFRTLHRWAQKAVAQCVACSKQDEALFAPVARQVTLIENGVDLTALRPIADDRRQPNRFLYVGRLSRSKRIDRLLRTFGELKKLGADFELHIAGPDWENLAEELANLSHKLGIADHVAWLGRISDERLLGEFAQAAFFVSASEYEGFGISAVEAMAAGCVPILSDIPAFANLVADGQSGMLADFTQPATAQRIAELLTQDVGAWRAAARESAEQYAWEAKLPQWQALYRQVLE